MQLAYDHALDRGNCVFLNEKRPLLILTPLDLTNPLIISVDQPKKRGKIKLVKSPLPFFLKATLFIYLINVVVLSRILNFLLKVQG